MNLVNFGLTETVSARKAPDLKPLEQINNIITHCKSCDLAELPVNRDRGKQLGYGKGYDLMFVTQNPPNLRAGINIFQDIDKSPVNKIFCMMLKEVLGLDREQVYITHIVKCSTPNNSPPIRPQTETCNKYILSEINILNPLFIIPVGKYAQECFNAQTKTLKTWTHPDTKQKFRVVGISHPASASRTNKIKEYRQQFEQLKIFIDSVHTKIWEESK